MIWNVLYLNLQDARHDHAAERIGGPWSNMLLAKHIHLDFLPVDEWNDRFIDKCAELKAQIGQEPFNRVFDLLQFIMRQSDCPSEFIAQISRVFRDFQLAYVINTDPPISIVPAATVHEGEQLTRSLKELRSAGLDGCTTHLRNESQCINDGDWRGSVHESINAVESVAKKIAPKANTLSAALSVLKKQGVLHHKELVSALGKLYNYTSDEDGIRHALSEAEANVTQDEALFMLGACASFASYLWRKHKAANSP